MSEFYLKVAGVTFNGRQRIVARLKPGQVLYFDPEPSNAYDDHAVKIITDNGEQVGYVPKEKNRCIFDNITNQKGTYTVTVSSITGGGFSSNYGCNIHVVYVPHNNSESSKKNDSGRLVEECLDRLNDNSTNLFLSKYGKYHELYTLYEHGQFRKMVQYFEVNGIRDIIDLSLYYYSLLFVGDYERIKDEYEKTNVFNSSISEDSPYYLNGCMRLQDKLLGFSYYHTQTIDLIYKCAVLSIPFISIRDYIDDQKYNGNHACVNYRIDDIKGYFEKMSSSRKYHIPNNPSLDDIHEWCFCDNANGDEKLAFATAEHFFMKDDFITAAQCYLVAMIINWGDPKYYAYYGQCMLRSNSIMGGLFAGREATKIAISLDPENVEWRIMSANLLSRMQMLTPFNVLKQFKREIEFIECCPNLSQGNLKTIDILHTTYQSLCFEMK